MGCGRHKTCCRVKASADRRKYAPKEMCKNEVAATKSIVKAATDLDMSLLTETLFSANIAIANGRSIAWHDFIYYVEGGNIKVGQTLFHVRSSTRFMTCIQQWTILSYADGAHKCKKVHSHALIDLNTVLDNAIVMLSRDRATVLTTMSVQCCM